MKRLLFGCLGLVLIACNDRSLPTVADSIDSVVSIRIEPNPVEILEGAAMQLQLVGIDKHGRKIERPLSGTWTSLTPEIATITANGRIVAQRAGHGEILARYESLEARARVHVMQIPAAEVIISPSGIRATTIDTIRFSAIVRDSSGNVLPNRRVIWSSNAPTIASIDSLGVMIARSAGTAHIRAQSGPASAYAIVHIEWAPVATVLFDPDHLTLLVGDRIALEPIFLDEAGHRLPSTPVLWNSDDPNIAVVDREGNVRALAIGSTLIRAHAGDAEGTVRITVLEPDTITIATIKPNSVAPGEIMIITGQGFAHDPSANEVKIDGIPANLLHASPTELRIRVPDLKIADCAPPKEISIEVRSMNGGNVRFGQKQHRAHAASAIRLGVGEIYHTLDAAALDCIQLAESDGRYVIAVINTSDNPATAVGFQLVGEVGNASSMASKPMLPRAVRVLQRDLERERRARQHAELLEANRRYARYARAHRPAPEQVAAKTVAFAPAIGDRISIRIPSLSDLCNDFVEIQARVVYVGESAIILEDPNNPGAGSADAQYQAIGAEFETDMLPILREHFGNPLAIDPLLDANGRIYMLFSQAVSEMGGEELMGFVSSVDFLPRSLCAASNEGEIFYAQAPANPALSADWYRAIRSTVIHEVKHLISYAERISLADGTSATFEERWLEEATAMIAEELWARRVYGFRQYGNTNYRNSLYCEVRGANPGECYGKPRALFDHFYFLSKYYEDIENKTPIGQSEEEDITYYGSGWKFVRWVIDQYAIKEASFLRGLTQTMDVGIKNLTSRAGVPFPEMLIDWALAIASDDYSNVRPSRDKASFPSWNTRDIFRGLHEDFAGMVGAFDRPFPLAIRELALGSFEISVERLRGGTAAFFELSGSLDAPQTLLLRGPGAAGVSPQLGIAIIRLE